MMILEQKKNIVRKLCLLWKKRVKQKKKDGLDRSKIMAKTKGKKEATDKVIQLESAKIMAQQVIAAMQSTAVSEKSPGEENSVILVRDEQPLSISTPNPISRESTLTNNDKDVTSSNPSPLPSPKLTSTKTYDSRTRENESLSKTSHRNSCSTPYSPSNLMANSHTYITLTTPQPRQRDLIPDHDPTPIKSTTPVNRVASARQLHFQPDITNSTEELSSEINNAICLSYNCNQWQAEPDDAEFEVSAPKCQQCEELREENSRLKAIIEKLQLEKESSTMPEAPAAAVMYLESLTKYLRGIHTRANDEIVLVESPQNHTSESHITHLNTMPKLKIMPPVSAAARPSNIPTSKSYTNTTTSSSSHFEDGDGKQELCPGSGVYIPTIKLRQCHHKAGAEMKVLFHVLMDHFFTDEVLAKSVAFGNRVVPSGKEILNPKIVSAIKGYLLSAAKVFNVTPLDGAKLNKMFTNKCTTAQTKVKKKLMIAK